MDVISERYDYPLGSTNIANITEFGFPNAVPTAWLVEACANLSLQDIPISEISFGFRSKATESREGRYDAADESFPVIVGDRSSGIPLNMPHLVPQGDQFKYRMLDGAHRTCKQKAKGATTVKAYVLTKEMLTPVIIKEAWMKLKEINCPHAYMEMYLAPESL
jgi:hypothetical protein